MVGRHAGRSTVAALVGALGVVGAARAEPRPPARGLVTEVAVRVWHLRSYDGGPVTMRGTSVVAGVGAAIAPPLHAVLEYELAQPGDETHIVHYLSGAVTYRAVAGLRVTAALVAARMHLAHRGDHTGLGVGAAVGYEVNAGDDVVAHVDLGARVLGTYEDEGSDDAPRVPGAWLGLGVTWY